MNINKTLFEYKKLKTTLSLEEEKELLYKYVYFTNKLEGNKLTFSQTSQLLSTDTVSGNNVRTTDILEQKGMYKALVRMLKAVKNKEILSIELLLELNWLSIGHLWKYDDAYIDAKSKGQEEGVFKVSKNVIRIFKGSTLIERIEPLSSPENVVANMNELVQQIINSKKDVIIRAAFLAQELWLHQPFVDGNKRTGRLAINFLTMKEGFPLFIFDDNAKNYNSLLVDQYMNKKRDLVISYIEKNLSKEMEYFIDMNKGKKRSSGYRMLL
jgi:Fic family protein